MLEALIHLGCPRVIACRQVVPVHDSSVPRKAVLGIGGILVESAHPVASGCPLLSVRCVLSPHRIFGGREGRGMGKGGYWFGGEWGPPIRQGHGLVLRL